MRGENWDLQKKYKVLIGPSPRAWGKSTIQEQSAEPYRSIPTCVGKINGAKIKKISKTVHPHVRGENCKGDKSASTHHGPSPRAWGKSSVAYKELLYLRSIPTCVGKIYSGGSSVTPGTVHPHVRGENLVVASAQNSAFLPRSIPTCVGKISQSEQLGIVSSVHPHVRGENTMFISFVYIDSGPSPRAWGKFASAQNSAFLPRSIPTCVGKICRQQAILVDRTVHPHVRGENL